MADVLQNFYDFVDQNQDSYVKALKKWVEVESVSAWPHRRKETIDMVIMVGKELESLGANIEMCDNPLVEQKTADGKSIPLPPILLGSLGSDPSKKTVCIYGHLDVQPALKADGWDTEPFEMTEIDGKLYGRGSTDDKGPVLGWLKVIEAFHTLNIKLPVNLKFCLEGMEESGSEGLDELIELKKDTFFKDVDYVCISDNYWLGKKTPCITYGLRGITYFFLEVTCAKQDLHSGVFGGTVHEAMIDLCHLLSKLVDNKGKILIPGVNELVKPITEEEHKLYDDIDFDPVDYANDIGTDRLIHHGENVKHLTLQHRWRYPSLSIHGVQGSFDGAGCKTVIPKKVIGKFSIRLVPDQTPEKIADLVKAYCEKIHKESQSPNKLTVTMAHGGMPWLSDYKHPHYSAGINSMKRVFNITPDLTREGGSIPVTLSMQKATGKSVILLPIGSCDDGAHSQNEKIDRSNLINGIKVMGAYLDEISKIED
ncbi:cytosolic non-specific dipeptidase isoform X1 [Hydra vulgaris]|uniref:Cytosolic non-specific dipeptidase n=1 Tax=Hydra vulgaris TaxID=6087 RepID=T2M7Q2_HYDVU|nr:cytosolic non-specific dipeptidase [Hydra vulgaris]